MHKPGRRHAADEEAAGEKPERATAPGVIEGRGGEADGVGDRRRILPPDRCAVGAHTKVFRPVLQEPQDERHDERHDGKGGDGDRA